MGGAIIKGHVIVSDGAQAAMIRIRVLVGTRHTLVFRSKTIFIQPAPTNWSLSCGGGGPGNQQHVNRGWSPVSARDGVSTFRCVILQMIAPRLSPSTIIMLRDTRPQQP